MKRTTTAIASLALMLASASATATAAATATAGDGGLGWLAGHWCGLRGDTFNEETWMAPRGDLLLGMHRDTRAGRVVGFEFMRIAWQDGRWVLLAQPGGGDVVAFPAEAVAGDRIVFANRDHDFPKRVIYARLDAGTLEARIDDGRDDGKAMAWTWTRDCAVPPDADAGVRFDLNGVQIGMAYPLLRQAVPSLQCEVSCTTRRETHLGHPGTLWAGIGEGRVNQLAFRFVPALDGAQAAQAEADYRARYGTPDRRTAEDGCLQWARGDGAIVPCLHGGLSLAHWKDARWGAASSRIPVP